MAKSASDQIKAALKQAVPPKAIKRAAARALNKTMTSVRAEASRMVKDELPSLKASDIKKELTVEKAKATDSIGSMKSVLVVSPKPIELYKFAAKPKRIKTSRGIRMGVTVKVKERRKVVEGGFIAQMRSGKVGVWKRTGQTTSSGKDRIKLLFSTKVEDIFRNDGFMDTLGDYAGQRLETVFTQEINFEIGKVSG